jgi:hypothetical protein
MPLYFVFVKPIPVPEHFEKTFDSMAVSLYLHPTAG